MTFPRKLLNEGEELVLDLRPHWWFLLPQMTVLVVAAAFGIASVTGLADFEWMKFGGALLFLAALIWFGLRYAVWVTTNFVLTSDRLISREGVLAKSGIEIPLERINTVFFQQSISGMIARRPPTVGRRAANSRSKSQADLVRARFYVQWRTTRTAIRTGQPAIWRRARQAVASSSRSVRPLQKCHLTRRVRAQKARLSSRRAQRT